MKSRINAITRGNPLGTIADSITPLGDSALRIYLSTTDENPGNVTPRSLWQRLKTATIPGITDLSFSYETILVQYDPLLLTFDQAAAAVAQAAKEAVETQGESRVFQIPVCYGGDFGPDLSLLCAKKSLTADEFIALHAEPEYVIATIGFMPGFAYLDGMNPVLAEPRKSEPRLKIAPGSVGIAGGQTGIYPLESPGGWQIIGRTPIDVFDPERNPAVLYQAGDLLRFVPIGKTEFQQIRQAVEDGTFDYESVVTA